MEELWNGTYREPAYWQEAAEALVARSNLTSGMRVLDVGSAGGGTLFPALGRIGGTGSIVGIEVEKDWVEWLSKELDQREIRNAESLLMNAQSMDFPDDAFDAVIMGMVGLDDDYNFETGEILNEAPLVRELLRVLKPGCLLSSSNWLWQEDNEWMGTLVRQYLPGCDKHGYCRGTQEDYRILFGTSGFDDIRATSFERVYKYNDPAEWMACVGYMWKEELAMIKADADALGRFDRDAFALLADHATSAGQIEYTRSTLLISARKPPV